MQHQHKEKIRWSALEYIYKKKSADWFWTFGIITLSVIVVGIMFDNYYFSIAIGLSAFLIIMYSFRRPLEITCELNRSGVIIDSTLYPYASLESFWVEENGPRPKILIVSKKKIMPLIAVPLQNIDPQTIRDFLDPLLPQIEIHESTSHQILEHWGI